MTSGALLACAVALLALPSAVLAFSSRFEPKLPQVPAQDAMQSAQTPKLAAHLAPSLPVRSLGKGQMFRFTPAGTESRPDRSVTVAVRVDPATANTLVVRAATGPLAKSAPAVTPLQIAPTAFSLGVSRGYHSFAQTVAPVDVRRPDMPDLSNFKLQPGDQSDSSFAPRIVLDQKLLTGRAPRTFSGSADSVDVGGAYSLTRNLDVTAGVRYSQERERLKLVTDRKQDAQAVYVGTQFRF